ncbi:MAG: acetylxylan esterase [Candidatus Hydrogenedentes bacterium]|nr:acetylxylan esterase [Candidatus Hydrogenedentota bacterium]
MPPVEVSLEQLRVCLLPQRAEQDFDSFWTLITARNASQRLNPAAEPMPFRIPEAHVEKVSFDAFDGGRIVGWSIAPANMKPHPTLIFFQDYGQPRPAPAEYIAWTLLGFTCLAFDTRGQAGESSDYADYAGGRGPGWLTSGLSSPDKYYLVRAFADAVRAIDFAATCMEVDAKRVGVLGVGQGGAFALAASALDARPALCVAAAPTFCHFGEGVGALRGLAPCAEIADWLDDRPLDSAAALRTLSYVELNNLAARVNCPAMLTAGLRLADPLLPGIFSTANRIPARDKVVDLSLSARPSPALIAEPVITFVRRILQPKR